MNQENKQLKAMLEAEKQEFLTVLSHELRTPMTAVKGYLAMILDGDAGEVGEKMRKYVSAAFVANERSIKLVENMMTVVSLQEEQMKFNLKKINLTEMVEIVVHDFAFPAREKGLELIYQKFKEPIFIMADPDRAREIIVNLISNAIKFTHKGSVTINFDLLNENEGRLAAVFITDTGLGVAPENQKMIFEIFTKENTSLADQAKGTGLGLFMAGKLAEAQGGKVWLEKSIVGQGSTFAAAFPVFEG